MTVVATTIQQITGYVMIMMMSDKFICYSCDYYCYYYYWHTVEFKRFCYEYYYSYEVLANCCKATLGEKANTER